MKNEIVYRVFDFLKGFPPFNMLPNDSLMKIATSSKVKFIPKHSSIYKKGERPDNYFYVVQSGAVRLLLEDNDTIEMCDEGDVFGMESLKENILYNMNATSIEDSILYGIDTNLFKTFCLHNHQITQYLKTNFALDKTKKGYDLISLSSDAINTELFTIHTDKTVYTCTLESSIQEAAGMMVNHNIGSVVICDKNRLPIGIVTDKDLRTKVVAGTFSKDEPVSNIMSSPVICVANKNCTLAELQFKMIRNKIHHLVITKDGSNLSPVTAIVSDHDLVVHEANSPSKLLKDVYTAKSSHQLKAIRDNLEKLIFQYLEKEVSIQYVAGIASEINDEIYRKAIMLAMDELDTPGIEKIKFCWLSLGSAARSEQLLRTDHDSALIFLEDPEIPEVQNICLKLALKVARILKEVGYDYCPSEMMASNPSWCLSLDNWKRTFRKWIEQPGQHELMMSNIFFDFRPLFGDYLLANELTDYLSNCLDDQDIFLHLMARNVIVNPPPLTFFRNFMVEKNGAHKNEFDIKLRAIMPFTDAARLLILEKRIHGVYSTITRFEKIAEIDQNNAELWQLSSEAYKILMRIRTLNGLKNQNDGRYIRPEKMNKMQRLLLRNSFQALREIENILKIRFGLSSIL